MFYISGTVNDDRTLKTNKNMKKYILIDSDNLKQIFDYIQEMNADFNKTNDV